MMLPTLRAVALGRRPDLVLVAVLLAGLVAELPLAQATLPDPPWVPGVYDEGDYDNTLALCADLASPGEPVPELPVAGLVAELLVLEAPLVVATTVDLAVHPRAPPFA